MYKKIKFSASAMCFDWLNVKKQLDEIEKLNLDFLHIDIIDGNFIPDFTMGSSIINSIRTDLISTQELHGVTLKQDWQTYWVMWER